MNCRSLIFAAPEEVITQEEELPPPGPGQALVRVQMSAISPGTEMLAYTGRIPEDMPLDESIASLGGDHFKFPFKYGYSSVGEVIDLGEDCDPEWLGKNVFSFHPHESAYIANLTELIEIPDGIQLEDTLFLPNMETAVNFVMDGRPMIGESVAVFGLGIVGLLTTALLAQFPLSALAAFDRFEKRLFEGQKLGPVRVFQPDDTRTMDEALAFLSQKNARSGADLSYEISGSPAALNQAIALTGFDGRVVIGSWYGRKPVQLDLGGRFHRSRIQLISSQVSSLASELSGRWTKPRRLDVAWKALRQIQPARWITHRFPIAQAQDAYSLLVERPGEAIQVIFEY